MSTQETLESAVEEPPPDPSSLRHKPDSTFYGLDKTHLSKDALILLTDIYFKNGTRQSSYKSIIDFFVAQTGTTPELAIQTLDEMKTLGLIPRKHTYCSDSPCLTERGKALYAQREALTI